MGVWKSLVDQIGRINTLLIGKRILNLADGIHFLNAIAYKHPINLGISKSKMQVISIGVDTTIFRPNIQRNKRKELGIGENETFILFCGTT